VTNFVKNGVLLLFRGARRGQSPLAALGAAMSVIGWLRSRRGPERELIYTRTLKDGEAVTVRLLRDGSVASQQTVEG
jgi:hypothetical protein